MTKLAGRSLIGFREGNGSGGPLYATNPATGQHLEPGFIPATKEEVDFAVRLASDAFTAYSRTTGRDRGAFLRTIAAKIESISAEIVERAQEETALPQARLQGETARTCAQLRLFAEVAEEGSWVSARIDRADPDRKPAASPISVPCCVLWGRSWFSARVIFPWRFRSPAATPLRRFASEIQ